MTWCHQATSHHLRQCWSKPMMLYVVTRPHWVNSLFYKKTLCCDPIVIEHLQSKSRCVSITQYLISMQAESIKVRLPVSLMNQPRSKLVNFTIIWCINVCLITICEHIKYDMNNSFMISFHSWQTPTLHICCLTERIHVHINGIVLHCGDSIANAME